MNTQKSKHDYNKNFFRSHKKNKYRWFKVERFGDGGVDRWWLVVGGWWLVVSQRVIRVTLRKTFRNHVNEAGGGSSAAKLFALGISWFNTCDCAWLLITVAQLCRRNSNRN